jgi:DNA-binding response OmpR family regulator
MGAACGTFFRHEGCVMSNIVLCSQHPAQLLWLDHYFRRANHSCRITTEWEALLGVLRHTYVDVVLLDAAMGDAELRCQQLRGSSDVPLIIIGARGGSEERRQLLAAGADDVLDSDALFAEVLACTESKLRRSQAEAAR